MVRFGQPTLILTLMLRTLCVTRWRLPQALKGLAVMAYLLCVPNAFVYGKEVYQRFTLLRSQRGLAFAILYYKRCRWVAVRALTRTRLTSPGVRTDRYGFPMVLPISLRQELRNPECSRITKACALFYLSVFSLYKGKVKWPVITSTITNPSTLVPGVLARFEKRLPQLLLKLGLWELEVGGGSYHPTNRSGPNGHALLSAHLDAAAMKRFMDVDGHFLRWVTATQRPKARVVFLLPYQALMTLWEEVRSRTGFDVSDSLILGRIALKAEHGKFRLFAIVDYFTQAALGPLHKAVMQALRNIPMDAAFNQDSGATTVMSWTREGNRTLHSFDLSSATDRFPIKLQSLVLNHLLREYGKGLGDVWRALLTDRDYYYCGRPYRYQAGQPMGALSSWAVFSLCHHVVVQFAAELAGFDKTFTEYTLLGDDIVIANEQVAHHYTQLMTQLGVGINLDKSIVASHAAEFAKRTFLDGEELTGLMWDLFSKGSRSFTLLYTILVQLKRRDFLVSLPGLLTVTLGPPSNKTYARGLKSFLLALWEEGGPLEDFKFWWLLGSLKRVDSVWENLLGQVGSHIGEIDDVAQASKDNPVWKASTYRLQLLGYDLAAQLKGQLDHVLGSALEQTWDEFNIRRGITSYQRLPRDLTIRIGEIHPARKVLEDGLNPSVYSDVAQELRVLTRADREELYVHRDIVDHADARWRGIFETLEMNSMY